MWMSIARMSAGLGSAGREGGCAKANHPLVVSEVWASRIGVFVG